MDRVAWKKWASSLKKNTYALYLASKNPRVPIFAKIIIVVVVAYTLSPIDLIPDFIPIIGYLDDLLVLPLGIWIAIRLIPQEVWKECQTLAEREIMNMPKNYRAAIVIIAIWVIAISGFIYFVLQIVHGAQNT
jgi:uncharacterized membrane protein YkvA (DUF1232 family)